MSARIQRRSVRTSRVVRQSIIVTSDDAFTYALRTAYLHYLLQPRPRRQIPAPPPPAINRTSTGMSFQDLIQDFSHAHRDPKSTRFPKEFLPILQRRMEGVWMGRDPRVEFKDAAVKRTVASFYTQFKEPRFYDGIAKSRRPEDLLLIFYSAATKELQRSHPDDAWKPLVDRHVALFVRLMFAIIKDNGWASSHPELATRLGTLEKKLLRHDENLAEESQGSGAGRTILGPPEPLSYNVNDMPMVKVVARVFGVSLEQCQEDINRNKTVWTERAALQDMKAYTNNLSLNTRRTLRADDFDFDESYDAWKKAETQELSKVMLAIIQSNPQELSKTTTASPARPPGGLPRHAHTMSTYSSSSQQGDRSSVYSNSPTIRAVELVDTDGGLSMANGASEEDDDTPYVYIPPDPRLFYRHVVDKCISYDINDPELKPIDLPEADRPLHLLSKDSLDLLELCGLRWRIPQFSRMVITLDCVRTQYQDQEIDLATVDGAFIWFKREVGCNHPAWTIADQNMFRTLLPAFHDTVLRELWDLLQHAYDNKVVPIGRVLWVLDQHIYSEDMFQVKNVESYIEQLQEGLRERAVNALMEMMQTLPQEIDQLDPLHVVELTQKIIKLAEKVSKRFKEPILGAVDPTIIFIETVFPKFAIEAREMILELMRFHEENKQQMELMDGFDLYKELREIQRIHADAVSGAKFPVRFEDLLAGFVWRWLKTIDSSVIGWVDAAIREDTFALKIREMEGREPLDSERHTSSVVDMFRSFNQPVDFLRKLDWGDEFQHANFMTALSKILGKGVARYCEVLEKLFTFEMDKPTVEQEAVATQTRQQKWMALAREAWTNKDKIEPFQFAPESCVKLNNIEFAIQNYDKLEQTVGADAIATVVQRHTPPAPQRTKHSYVFTIKIIEAEDLKAMDMNGYSDPYVVLGDEHQKRLAKTRIVYANLNPRWEETFDITTTGPVWLTATVWDWDTMGDHDCLGRTNIKLDPANFMDFLPKEFWLDLDIQGRLLLRVSMEGERDDIQFHFGKAFRTLTRTQRDMTRQITDKLSAYIHHCLSRAALKSISSRPYNLSSVTTLFNRASIQARPQSTIIDVNAVLNPLTNYFNENFAILNTTLTSTAMLLVMSKLWKEVLSTLELLLVPTLSDKPSQQKPLTEQESEIVYKWLQTMFDFFHAVDEDTGQPTGVPIETLKTPKYHDLQSLSFFYFMPTDELIRESERMAAESMSRRQKRLPPLPGSGGGGLIVPGSTVGRSKSVINKRNLGTIKQRKEERRREAQAEPNDDMILRILRMRPESAGYLRERSRQKERLEAVRVAEGIVAMSIAGGGAGGRMAGRR